MPAFSQVITIYVSPICTLSFIYWVKNVPIDPVLSFYTKVAKNYHPYFRDTKFFLLLPSSTTLWTVYLHLTASWLSLNFIIVYVLNWTVTHVRLSRINNWIELNWSSNVTERSVSVPVCTWSPTRRSVIFTVSPFLRVAMAEAGKHPPPEDDDDGGHLWQQSSLVSHVLSHVQQRASKVQNPACWNGF